MRVRLTIIATLAFAIAISAAAFGLVRLVRTNLVDRIQETNAQQLDDLAAAVQQANLQPPSDHGRVYCCVYDPNDGQPHLYTRQTPRAGYEQSQREIQTTAGNITLVAQQSTGRGQPHRALGEHRAAVRSARAHRSRRARGVVLHRPSATPSGSDPSASGVDHAVPPSTVASPSRRPTTRSGGSRAR